MIEKKIHGLIQKAVLRLRLQQFAEGFATGAVPALALGGLGFILTNAGWVDIAPSALLALAGVPLAWGTAYAALFKVDPHNVAVDIDEANALKARLTSAYCFAETPEKERTPFMDAAIRDAADKIKEVDVRPASPFGIPRDAIAMGVATLCLLAFFVNPPQVEPLPPVVEEPTPEPEAILDDATRQALTESWKEERENLLKDEAPETKELVKEMDDLYDKLEKRDLKKEDFFSEVDRINDKFFKDEKTEFTALEEELKDLAKELDDNKETKALADALKSGDLDKAAKEVENIANKIADGKMSDRDIEKVAKTLEKGGKKLEEQAEKLAKQLKENKAAQEALKKKGEELSKKDKQKLSRLGRDFEKLKKMFDFFEGSGKRKAKKKISKGLDQAAKSARKMKKRGKDAAKGKEARAKAKQDMKKGAKAAGSEMKHTKKKAAGEKAKSKAKKNLSKLKENVKRARVKKPGQKGAKGKDGKQQAGAQGKKPQTFEQRAGGKKPKSMAKIPQPGKGQEGKEGKKGQSGSKGNPGGKAEGKADASGKKGKKSGEMNEGSSDADGKKGTKHSAKGKGGDALGKATELEDAEFKSASVSGKDSGQGQSKAEVIASAAEKGFASQNYADVHAEYEHVAEEALEKESIPAGYRFYIQSYFDRIRPRKADEDE